MARETYGMFGNEYLQRGKVVIKPESAACGPTPMDGVVEYADDEDMSQIEIETNQNDTHIIEHEGAPSPMNIDR